MSGPATNAQEAIQWTYFGYLAAVVFRTVCTILRSYLHLPGCVHPT
ncbi:hypothetical protein ACLK1S_05590 [Escherichia coli]